MCENNQPQLRLENNTRAPSPDCALEIMYNEAPKTPTKKSPDAFKFNEYQYFDKSEVRQIVYTARLNDSRVI